MMFLLASLFFLVFEGFFILKMSHWYVKAEKNLDKSSPYSAWYMSQMRLMTGWGYTDIGCDYWKRSMSYLVVPILSIPVLTFLVFYFS